MQSNLAEEIEKNEVVEETDYLLDYSQTMPLPKVNDDNLAVPKGMASLEIKIMVLIGSILFALLLLNVHTDLQLAKSSRNVQDLNHQIEETVVEKENLEQHIHELSRYDRIQRIAEDYGLKLHEENIRNLSPLE